jgi:pimeloyl-ACP methyl ester carboxylesterase
MVDLVEAVHARIVSLPFANPSGGQVERTRGLTGLVYNTVRGVTRGVGGGMDALLGWLQPTTGAVPTLPTPEREAVLAALNGVLGDRLAATGSALATPMTLRQVGAATPRVLVLLHGLCMHDGQWLREFQGQGHSHGAWLAQQSGWTPVYLRYNTGLPIARNGRELAAQLQVLAATWPVPIERLALLGHSMGGLVARSAIAAGLPGVTDLVCLGTPHHGAPLERAGHGLDRLLAQTPGLSRYSAPFTRLTRLRSAGITDLRHGLDTALPQGVRCRAVAGKLATRGLGDGIVPVASALASDPAREPHFAEADCLLVPATGHLDLLSSPTVAQQLSRWLA